MAIVWHLVRSDGPTAGRNLTGNLFALLNVDAMDAASDQVRAIFAAPAGAVDVGRNRDGLGITHHEGGTLRMGISPTTSVTTPNAKFHLAVNAYVAGPALLPSLGSPNPKLSGVVSHVA